MKKRIVDFETMEIDDSIYLKNELMIYNHKKWKLFDIFLLEKWSGISCKVDFETLDDKELNDIRKVAYRNFNKAVKGVHVANSRTIRKWFGIDEFVPPKREMFFKIAFALKLSVEEAKEYLVKGMLKPEFQINDYQEMIYLYGLENELDFDFCNSMIEIFERKMSSNLVVLQENHTEQLYEIYEMKKYLKPEEFVNWMLSNEELFKGYSKTVLDYFELLKTEICKYIKKDSQKYLEELLKYNGYENWKNNRKTEEESTEEQQQISFIRYLARSKKEVVREEDLVSVRKAYRLAYGEENDSEFIRELFSFGEDNKRTVNQEKQKKLESYDITFMTNKYLSQILTVAEQKASLMKLKNIKATISEMSDEKECPEEIEQYLKTNCDKMKSNTIKDAKKAVAYLLKHQTQRCQLIGRDDLLPMVHYLAQKRYEEELIEKKTEYNMEEARDCFINVANAVLSKCKMALISPEYRSDYLMLKSFTKRDMYSVVDMVELALQTMEE